MSTCNWLDLQTLGSQSVMPKNLPKISWQRYTLYKDVLSLTHVNALGKNYKQLPHINGTQKPMVMNLSSYHYIR